MFKKSKRALRRHHRARMVRRALTYWNVNYDARPISDPWVQNRASRHHDHLAICSCYMCGNQRHNGWLPDKEKMTMQERKEYQRFIYEMEEVDDMLSK